MYLHAWDTFPNFSANCSSPNLALINLVSDFISDSLRRLNWFVVIPNLIPNCQIKSQLVQIMDLYNDERPHSELNMSTPSAFERLIENLPIEKRPKMEVYKWVTPLLTNNPVQIKREEKSKKNKPEAVILNS